MINLNDIIQSAQGGQAVDNLASRFGLTPQQVQSAINAILPAITMGMQNAAQSGQAGAVLSQLGSIVHQQSYADPNAATSGPAVAHAGSILGSLFGGHQNTGAVAQQAANESGIEASVIQAMLPVILSMVMGGLMHSAGGGAVGGALSSILGSVLGQGGSIFGSGTPGGAQAPPPSADSGLGGVLGSVLGGLFGGGAPQAQAPAGPAAAPAEGPPAAGGAASSILEEISTMIQPGTPASADHQNRLAQIIGR